MNGLGGRILKSLDGRELVRFVLLAAVLGSVALGMAPRIFRSDSLLLITAVLAGLTLGWFTGRIPLPPAAAACADAALGLDVLFVLIARLDLPIGRCLVSGAGALLRLLPQFRGLPFDAAAWLADAQRILLGPVSLLVRSRDWAAAVAGGRDFFDPVAAAFFWSLLLLLVGIFAGWALAARSRPLAAALPALLLQAAVFASVRGDWHPALVSVALALGLVTAAEYIRKEEEWDRKAMGYSTALRMDLGFAAGPVLAALLACAYVVPSISLDDISRWIREQSRPGASSGSSASSFGLNPAPGDSGTDAYAEAFARSHYLGAGPQLTQDVMLVIVTGETLIRLPGERDPVAPQHYWTAQTFDIYSGSGWLTSPTGETELAAGSAAADPPPAGEVLHQAVTVTRPGLGPLYYTGVLARVYQTFRLLQRSDSDLFGVLVPGAAYEADSVIVDPGEAQLRAAGREYPAWIRGRYLQLPKILPQRIDALARRLTAAEVTPYDQALAIQDYLRREMRYSLDVPAPPYDRDGVDYFLFESKRGFCDYFASAMVVLARSAGIPARLAVGYATGTFDPGPGEYTVRDSDSHAWPELYFPGIGWVAFEPTSAQPVLRRAADSTGAPAAAETPAAEEPGPPPVWDLILRGGRTAAAPALILLLAVPILWLLWTILLPVRLRWQKPAALLLGVYRGMRSHARRRQIPAFRGTTPAELARLLGERNPAQAAALDRLAVLYARQAYGAKPLDAARRGEIVRVWPRVNFALWRNWLRETLAPRRRKGR